MGAGIAQVMAQGGYTVYLRDIETQFVDKGLATIAKALTRMEQKGKIDAGEKEQILGRIKGIVNLPEAGDADLAIEAALENLEAKKKIFAELDQVLKPGAVLATNTSSLSITAIGAVTRRPDKVVGMHFFNPAPVMKLVEVTKGIMTTDETAEVIREIVLKIGKTPVMVNESPGFIVNRMLVPMINEAIYLMMEGVASPEEIDTAMKLGASHPIGPLELADLIGLDILLDVMETFHAEFGEDKYRPCPLLRKMVNARLLGRKTGRGFYTY